MAGVANSRDCKDCGNRFATSRSICPHCGRPSYFPNVDKAIAKAEQEKLADRYNAALNSCKARNTSSIVEDFERACKESKAVFSLSVQKLYREIANGTDIFETYYDLEKLKNRTESATGLDWAKLRPQAEIELLGDHSNLDKLHYASLSIDGVALNYGNCIVTLALSMTEHRISCFEGNTAVLYFEKRSFDELVRSDWGNRYAICVVMFAADLTEYSKPSDFPSVLVQRGKTSVEDKFVEVHLFGPLTVQAFESVHFDRGTYTSQEESLADAIAEKLKEHNVEVI